jgi:hypothetical protein
MTAGEIALVSWNVNGLRAAAQKDFHGLDHCPVGLALGT